MPFYKEYSVKLGNKPRKVLWRTQIEENKEVHIHSTQSGAGVKSIYFIALTSDQAEIRVYNETYPQRLLPSVRTLEQRLTVGDSYFQPISSGFLAYLPIPVDVTLVGEK